MNPKQIIGLVALAIGVVLLIYGCQQAETYREQATHMMKGHYSSKTLWVYVVGTALTVAGIAGAVFFRKK